MNPGIAYATLAFVMWGLFPLYFRQIAAVPPLEVVLHRSVWSLLFVIALLAALRRFGWMRELAAQPRRLGLFALSALLLSGNWLLYVYAIHSGQVVEASLGYFINPIVNVLLGVLVLHERLNKAQWASVALAAAGVLWLTLLNGRLPWIALALAVSFAFYGLMRKTASLGALEGLALETMLLAPVVLPALAWWSFSGRGAMAQGDLALDAWLVIGGPLTALPLLLFAAGARRLPLATVGPAAVPVTHAPAGAGRVGVPRALRPRAPARLRLHLGRRWRCIRPTAGGARAQPRAAASGRRRADQVVEGRQRRLGAVAGGDDDLLVGHRRRVARGEHAGQVGGAARVDDDLAVAAQLDRALQELGVGHQADLHEHAGQFDRVLDAADAVLEAQAVDLAGRRR